jgi:hypothetical protein
MGHVDALFLLFYVYPERFFFSLAHKRMKLHSSSDKDMLLLPKSKCRQECMFCHDPKEE